MSDSYIERRDGGYRVRGTRVSLDSIVYAFRNGDSAETIAESFPVLSLEQVYGAIAFYLGHRAEVDEYLAGELEEFEREREAQRLAHPELVERLQEARRRLQTKS